MRRDRRGTGLGRLLVVEPEVGKREGTSNCGVANEGAAVNFYRRCRWQMHETVEHGPRLAVTVLRERLNIMVFAPASLGRCTG